MKQPSSTLASTAEGYRRWIGAELGTAMVRRGGSARPDGRKLMLIATFVPPDVAAGVYRPLSWLRTAEAHGWRASVVTRALPEPPSEAGRHLATQLPPSAIVRRLKHTHGRPSWRFYPRIDGSFLEALMLQQLAVETGRDDRPAVVVATGPHFSNFVAGYFAARRLSVPLVLDYRDEWSLSPFEFVALGNMDRYWERRCLRAVDAVLFTTESQLRHHEQAFPELRRGVRKLVPNGWDPVDWAAAEGAEGPGSDFPTGTISLAFLGYLGEHSLPGQFLNDLEAALEADEELRSRLRVRFVGGQCAAAKEQLNAFRHPANLVSDGHLPRPAANSIMRRSDALVLFAGHELSRYIPGKLCEYLASGRPILIHGVAGEASAIVERLGAGTHVPAGDGPALARAIRRLSEEAAQFDTAARREWVAEHSRDRIAERFFRQLDEITGGAVKGEEVFG